MRSHVKNRFVIESVTFVHFRVQERTFCSRDFDREIDHWVKTVCLEKEIFYFVTTCVVDESFPKDGFCFTLSEYFVSYYFWLYVGKIYTAIFVPMAVP